MLNCFNIMKADPAGWRLRRPALSNVIGCLLALSIWAGVSSGTRLPAGPLGPSDRPEAYFNGSSYIRLSRPISLKQIVGLSFRTCVGGELFSQRFEGYTLHVTALFEQVVVSWARPGQPHREEGLALETLDNSWHWVGLRYTANPPSLLLEVDRHSRAISNGTWNPELLSPGALEAGGAVVLVGNVFSGCIHEGPQLEFHAAHAQLRNVVFGACPLTTDACKDRKDVLRMAPKDHCYNEPCMRHGTCISRHDRYECHCTARYSGNNCEVDAGDPCASAPCLNGGQCIEDARGDYACVCAPPFRGALCELQESLDPQCVARPCRNNGSCSVPPGAAGYVCACPAGYAGRNCETDVDECAAAACRNGGRCVDAVNNYTCDCAGTGYTGARCELNVNECEEERNACNHGVCYDTYGSFVCACLPGYTGDTCQKMSACASEPCGAGGVCVEEGGGFRCVCARGWAPPLCAVPLPSALAPPDPSPAPSPAPLACAELECPPHSHCREATAPGRQATCACDPGYYGAPGPQPECSTLEGACEAGVCLNGATCTSAPDHFNCTCAPGFRGAYCESAAPATAAGKALSDLKAPAPERCASAPCVHALHCRDRPSGFVCECEAGWTGARCESALGCPALACLNGGACEAGACVCRVGWAGAQCEAAADCRAAGCAPHHECVEQGSAWRCAAAAADSACASSPCHNGTCLALDNGLFRCQCPPGNTGRFCEVDIDECALMPKICNFGVCVNVPGSYQCYCRPGYTGDSCEQDIDECLSAPCKNGGSCHNLENNYECSCVEGFEGKDCSMNIDECASGPCAAGATCVDGVASYACVCPAGLTGAHCEIDIDDCESQPCLHGGRCVDGVDSFHCECAGTGFAGVLCERNIDECASSPCRNGATCVDDVNDYRCVCHPGYTGKDCEVDVPECASNPCLFGGVCLERSNASLYGEGAEAEGLPAAFRRPFAVEHAGGFECVCVPGTTGARCEVNVDECASSPCGHGKCVDGVGGYSCECLAGYEGAHCEVEVDECARYAPCAHGRCYDGRASYYCACEPGWGGTNCSVVLTGCADSPCRNGGTCLPWLLHETEHRFNCSCAPGHYGTTCRKLTTMSLERTSYVEVNTSRDEGYDISFRFKTTLGNGLLAMGRGITYFFLELSNGRLNLHSSLLNKWEGVFIGSNLNDSNWQKVFVTINASHVVLAANEEQTIYPISQNELSNASVTSFPSTRLGTAGSSYAPLTHGPNFFVGCFQDVVVNSHWVLPEAEEAEGVAAVTHGVRAACPRMPQCEPNPCRSGGACDDLWTTFACTCPRPHLGATCQYNYTAATFGHEGARPHSVVRVDVYEAARRAVHAALDVSMFVRTHKPSGQIFYLGTAPRFGRSDETLVAAALRGGELLVRLRFNHTPEDYTVGGTRLDNGHLHLIQVVRNATLVQVKLNGTEYFRKSISAAKQLDAQVLYLGGPPPPPAPPSSPAPPPEATTVAPTTAAVTATAATATTTTAAAAPVDTAGDEDYFKGVIQDVQVSNGVNVTIVEFFPLEEPELRLPAAFGAVSLDPLGVLRGVVSDDACATRPCLHNASCTVTWNDFSCSCPRGYKGKRCAEVEFCQLQGCPANSHCRNLDGGYECVSNATFDGRNTTLAYRLRVPPAPALSSQAAPPTALSVHYRSKMGGTLLWAESAEGAWFSVGVFKAQVTLQWRLGGRLPVLRRMRSTASARDLHHWTALRISLAHGQIKGAFVDGDTEETGLTAPIDVDAWQRLMTTGLVHLGGRPTPPPAPLPTTTEAGEWSEAEGPGEAEEEVGGQFFKGCLGAVHVGSLLLPFFTEEELFVGHARKLLAAQPHYKLLSGRPWGAGAGVGCVLCLEQDCERGGHCADVRSSYACTCPAGYAGDYCQVDVDECADNRCQNGATCRDGVAAYACDCARGFEGEFCERDVDECARQPCLHGGTCSDGRGSFRCVCAADWTGALCDEPLTRSCAHEPCAPGRALCRDLPGNYSCECLDGFEGERCEFAFCESAEGACVHGHCVTQEGRCECEPGFAGRRCERELRACADRPCLHDGRCRDTRSAYECDCAGTGWTGSRCEVDVDECATGLVSCGDGLCVNVAGGFRCECPAGYCGVDCAVADPCLHAPCEHGECEPRCSDAPDYHCSCSEGWLGRNCSEREVGAEGQGGFGGETLSRVLIGVGCAAVALAALGAAGGALAAQARRKRATRGTYSPSGQEYCNPRAEMTRDTLKPPPEERLI